MGTQDDAADDLSIANALANTCLVRRRGSGAGDFSDGAIDWIATVALANDEFVAPALLGALRTIGARLPGDLTDYLDMLAAKNAERNASARNQAIELGRSLAAVGSQAVLLKGATWLFGLGPGGRDRMMRDIDVLVPAADLRTCEEAVHAIGYRPSNVAAEAGHVHDAPLHKPGGLYVELHVELTTRPWMLPSVEVLAEAVEVVPGLRLPAPHHRIVHNVLHAQIVNGDYHGGVVSLRDSLDLSRLMSAYGNEIDWQALRRAAETRGFFPQLSGALNAAALFTGGELPETLASDRGGRWHALRCAWQRRHPAAGRLLRRYGVVRRALAWDRDAYALALGDRRTLAAHWAVNKRRLQRIASAVRRRLDDA